MNPQSNRPHGQDTRELVRNLSDVGAAWARYGLTVAEASLKASSRTLDSTARALGNLAEAIQHPDRDDSVETEGTETK